MCILEIQFESEPGQELSWLTVFVVSLTFSRQIPGLCHDVFPPALSNSPFIINTLPFDTICHTEITTITRLLFLSSSWISTVFLSQRAKSVAYGLHCTAAIRFSTGLLSESLMMQSALVGMLHVRQGSEYKEHRSC
jgi:hypothetical protein